MNTKNIILAALISFAGCATPAAYSMQQRPSGEEFLISYAITGKADELEQFFKFYASSDIKFDINQELILRSAEVKGTSSLISRPLMYFACVNGHANVIKLLLKHGASINHLTSPKYVSPLHIVCQMGHLDAVKALLEDDTINVDARNEENVTSLYLVCQGGGYEVAKSLILKGANVDAKCLKRKCRPLHIACINGFLDIARLLLENDAEVNVISMDGETPLMLAEYYGHNKIAQLLRSYGAQ